jgi:hypothetical protein
MGVGVPLSLLKRKGPCSVHIPYAMLEAPGPPGLSRVQQGGGVVECDELKQTACVQQANIAWGCAAPTFELIRAYAARSSCSRNGQLASAEPKHSTHRSSRAQEVLSTGDVRLQQTKRIFLCQRHRQSACTLFSTTEEGELELRFTQAPLK